jgi:hypothetical protein
VTRGGSSVDRTLEENDRGLYNWPMQGINILEPMANPENEASRRRVLALSRDGVTLEEFLRNEPAVQAEPAVPRRRRSVRKAKLNTTDLDRNAVHALAAIGPVLPCIGKRPLISNGVHGASRDLSVIDGWLKRWPGCNIALATGSVVVIDLDGDQGEQSFVDLQTDVEPLPATLEVRTGNGRHLYFLSGQPIGNSVGKLGPGIDVRGHGGYVIAPPSIHQDTGKAYRFVDADVPLAELPVSIADLLA